MKNGFTLIEIIVVLIILGVLTAIAIPNYFSFINKSRTAEAIEMLREYKNRIVLCAQLHQNDPPPPGFPDAVNAHCSGGEWPITDNFAFMPNIISNSLWVQIFRVLNGSMDSSNKLSIIYDNNGNIITCSGIGIFAGYC